MNYSATNCHQYTTHNALHTAHNALLQSEHYAALSAHNLPELTMFQQDTTICKNCGISYMVYNNMRDQLERYR